MEVQEGNKLIAEFLGWERDDDTTVFEESTWRTNDGNLVVDLLFDESWDWLMPVVEKIESIDNPYHGYFGVHICSNGCTIQATNLRTDKPITNPPHYFDDVTLDTKILSTWYAIVRFIQFYNQQNK